MGIEPITPEGLKHDVGLFFRILKGLPPSDPNVKIMLDGLEDQTKALLQMLDMSRANERDMEAVLTRIADMVPWGDVMGQRDAHCHFCAAYKAPHSTQCPWVLANACIGRAVDIGYHATIKGG